MRTATWSESRMSTKKKDKDKGEKREKDKPEWVDLLEKGLVDALENQSEVLLKRMADMETKMDVKIEKSIERIKVVEQKARDMERDLAERNRKLLD